MHFLFAYFCSASLIIAGLVCLKRKHISIGIEGRQDLFIVKGKFSVIIGLICIAAGVVVFFKPSIIAILNFGGF